MVKPNWNEDSQGDVFYCRADDQLDGTDIYHPDDWTVKTDGGLSARFEHTIWVTAKGCEVLTARHTRLRNSKINPIQSWEHSTGEWENK